MGIILVAVAAYAAYLFVAARLTASYFRFSKTHSFTGRLFGRSTVLTLLWGLGFVGTEGFALPGPLCVTLLLMPFEIQVWSSTAAAQYGYLTLFNWGFFFLVCLAAMLVNKKLKWA